MVWACFVTWLACAQMRAFPLWGGCVLFPSPATDTRVAWHEEGRHIAGGSKFHAWRKAKFRKNPDTAKRMRGFLRGEGRRAPCQARVSANARAGAWRLACQPLAPLSDLTGFHAGSAWLPHWISLVSMSDFTGFPASLSVISSCRACAYLSRTTLGVLLQGACSGGAHSCQG